MSWQDLTSTLRSARVSRGSLLNGLLFLPVLTYALYWGTRAFDVGPDTQNYVWMFRQYLLGNPQLLATADGGFLALIGFAALWSQNPSALLVLICLLIAVAFYTGGVLILGRSPYLLLYVVLLLTSPYYLAVNINVLRHGLATAAAFLVMGLVVRYRSVVIKLILFSLPAWFHQVAGLITLPMIWGTYRRAPLAFWLLAAAGSALSGLYAPLVSGFLPGDYAYYLTVDVDYRTGFRPDFILFSTFPVLASVLVPYRKMAPETRWVFNAYLLMNGVGHLMNFVAYSDRFLISSWLLLPLLITLLVKDVGERAFRRRDNRSFFGLALGLAMLLSNALLYGA